ncbi:9023_t:CDS:2, partial [Acaulospora morrowiae]
SALAQSVSRQYPIRTSNNSLLTSNTETSRQNNLSNSFQSSTSTAAVQRYPRSSTGTCINASSNIISTTNSNLNAKSENVEHRSTKTNKKFSLAIKELVKWKQEYYGSPSKEAILNIREYKLEEPLVPHDLDDEPKKDQLGTSIWKYYTKVKNATPGGVRLENISWRLMSITMKKLIDDKNSNEDVAPANDDSVVSKDPSKIAESTKSSVILKQEDSELSMFDVEMGGPFAHQENSDGRGDDFDRSDQEKFEMFLDDQSHL